MKYIPLTNGKYAIVDNDDFKYLSNFIWSYSAGYAITTIKFFETSGILNRSPVSMHILINGNPINKKFVTDHINRNRLDNQKCNLRVVTHSENFKNSNWFQNHSYYSEQKNSPIGESGARGIWKTQSKKNPWSARIRYRGKRIHIGTFPTIKSAILARNKYIISNKIPYSITTF